MTRFRKYSWSFHVVGRLLAVLFLILASAEAPSRHATVYAQTQPNPCEAVFRGYLDAANQTTVAQIVEKDSEDALEDEMLKTFRTNREVNRINDRLAHFYTLEIFLSAGSPASASVRQSIETLQGKLKPALEKQAADRQATTVAMDKFVRSEETADLKQRAYDEAGKQVQACYAAEAKRKAQSPNTPPPVAASKPPATTGSIVYVLEDVASDPKAFYGGWTWSASGGEIHLKDPSVGEETFTWTAPAQRFGANGFPITLKVDSKSNPDSRALAGLHMVPGDFVATPNPAVEVMSENGQYAHKELGVTVKPPPVPPSGNDLYIRIGADYGPGFIYHYRVIR